MTHPNQVPKASPVLKTLKSSPKPLPLCLISWNSWWSRVRINPISPIPVVKALPFSPSTLSLQEWVTNLWCQLNLHSLQRKTNPNHRQLISETSYFLTTNQLAICSVTKSISQTSGRLSIPCLSEAMEYSLKPDTQHNSVGWMKLCGVIQKPS